MGDDELKWPTYSDIVTAYKCCKIKKKSSTARIHFELKLGQNLLNLYREIHSGTYMPSASMCFIVVEPKPREVFAAPFRDRVVHHLVVSELLKIWRDRFNAASFACIEGRGPYRALCKLQNLTLNIGTIRKANKPYAAQKIYALHLDIEKFFPTIHRETLLKTVLDSLPQEINYKNTKLRWLCEKLMAHDARDKFYFVNEAQSKMLPPGKSWLEQPKDRGIPIGNLTSQLAANIYLTEIDFYISETLKPQGYVRYMDDLLLLDRDKAKLKGFIAKISQRIEERLRQRINESKTVLKSLTDGVKFLGFHIKQVKRKVYSKPKEQGKVKTLGVLGKVEEQQVRTETGRISLLWITLTGKRKWKLVYRFRRLEKKGFQTQEVLGENYGLPRVSSLRRVYKQLSSYNSMLGYIRQGRSLSFRRALLTRLRRSEIIKNRTCDVKNWSKIKLHKQSYSQ